MVLHDIKKNQIVKIYNSFSKRQVGDSSCIDDIEGIKKGPDIHGPFMRKNFYGHDTKYTTNVLRDDDGRAIGLMCINFSIEGFQSIQNVFNLFLESTADSSELDELFNDDWENKINVFVQKFRKERNRSLSKLTTQERKQLVHSLHEAGAFRATNAANYIAKVLGVSRATIYNYLSRMETINQKHDLPKDNLRNSRADLVELDVLHDSFLKNESCDLFLGASGKIQLASAPTKMIQGKGDECVRSIPD